MFFSDLTAHLFTKPRAEQDFGVANEQGGFSREPVGALEIFAASNREARFLKWEHYFAVYQRHLDTWLDGRAVDDAPPRLLEIGVYKGGSLKMWRQFLGSRAKILGIDIDPRCADMGGDSAQVRIGSQSDSAFLSRVVDEMGGVDIVIDDGSHKSRDVVKSFIALFPLLEEGGLYIIEDLHAAYWPRFGGGLRRRSSSIEFLKTLIDEMHRPYLRRIPRWFVGPEVASLGDTVLSLEFSDSICVIRKGRRLPPRVLFSAGWASE